LDDAEIGENVDLRLLQRGIERDVSVNLVPFYSLFYVFVASISGFLFILVPIVVVLKTGLTKPTLIYHWVMVASGLIILNSWGTYHSSFFGISFASRIIFHLAYTFFASLFLHFTLVFPNEVTPRKKQMFFVYGVSLLLSTITLSYFAKSIGTPTIDAIHSYVFVFNISRIFVLVCLLVGVFNFAASYRRAHTVPDKKKLKWLLYGLTIGPLTFALLWVLPLAFWGRGLIPEELLLIIILVIPITFSISILKYHLWDIDRVINRSVVYMILLFGILAVYLLVVQLLASFATNEIGTFPIVITVAVIALVVQSLKRKVELFVDKTFFRVQYDFRFAVKKVLQELRECADLTHLAEACITGINNFIPVKYIAFASVEERSGVFQILAQKETNIFHQQKFWLKQEKLQRLALKPLALQDMFEGEINSFMGDSKLFKRLGLTILFPLKNSSDQIHALLLIGEKKAEQRFTFEDYDLLNQIAEEASIMYERITLHQKAVINTMEKQKLVELNELKSLLVASVSHELKTPLTSIRMFSEMLSDSYDNNDNNKSKDYSAIIEGECNRLTRMINNFLDLAKIEKGKMVYHIVPLDLKGTIETVLKLMDYQLKIEVCSLKTEFIGSDFYILGDEDTVEGIVLNLLSNALKYSTPPKVIALTVTERSAVILLNVSDNGIGMDDQEMENLAEPFYRSQNVEELKIEGTGIGLTVIKNYCDASHAQLDIKSEKGIGTTFLLTFPKEKHDENTLSY